MIVFVFYLSHCWGECATVGEVGQTVNLLPSGWVGSNPTTPTTISAKVKCFGKEYARLWRWAYLVCRCSTMVQCSSLPSWRWGFDSLHLLKFAGIAQRLVHRLAMPRMWVRFSLPALVPHPTSCVIVCSCWKSAMSGFTLAAYEALILVRVKVQWVCDYFFDREE